MSENTSNDTDGEWMAAVGNFSITGILSLLQRGVVYSEPNMHVWGEPSPTNYTIAVRLLESVADILDDKRSIAKFLDKVIDTGFDFFQRVDATGSIKLNHGFYPYAFYQPIIRASNETLWEIMEAFNDNGISLYRDDINWMRMYCEQRSPNYWEPNVIQRLITAGYDPNDKNVREADTVRQEMSPIDIASKSDTRVREEALRLFFDFGYSVPYITWKGKQYTIKKVWER